MSEATAGRTLLKLFHNFFAQFAADLEPLLHAIVVRVVHVKNTLTILNGHGEGLYWLRQHGTECNGCKACTNND